MNDRHTENSRLDTARPNTAGRDATSHGTFESKIESPLPKIWDVPLELRRRLSMHSGRQRSIIVDDHLVLLLHKVPTSDSLHRESVYFWSAPKGEWFFSEQGSGWAALLDLVKQYDERVHKLEQDNESGSTTKEWFAILDEIGPIHRAIRNLREAVATGLDNTTKAEQRYQLQQIADLSAEIERNAELLQSDCQRSVQFNMARQAEIQAAFSRSQSSAAHRLNILAAVFLPIATLSSIFGMNLASGLEEAPMLFWVVMAMGVALGVGIGIFVMNVRGLSPDEW